MSTILFAGGGSLGPVTPLLAVAARLREKKKDLRIGWAGTDAGPEREMVEAAGIPFATVPVAKLPRYASTKLLTAPFDYLRARRVSTQLVQAWMPRVVVSAGGFTAVPVIAEAVARHIPCITHQLDYVPGMSNRMAARHCRYVTTSFEYPVAPFHTHGVMYRIPTPTRFSSFDLPNHEEARKSFGLDPKRPTVLLMGGGQGAQAFNDAAPRIHAGLPDHAQVIHLTGRGKASAAAADTTDYVVRELLNEQEMLHAYAAADVVISRAGIGAISELAALQKAAILIPLPSSPQEQNAEQLGDAVITIHQSEPDWHTQAATMAAGLLADTTERTRLGRVLHSVFPTDKGDVLAALVLSVLK
jgi:UDP-N-acetylglucosamine--N-acetylmuramyl-(pentapeptide) pyrophosphoryl-undecaprenol N-acetylglucosamine transferase